MPAASVKPAPAPPWRYTPIAWACLLTLAWSSLTLAYFARPVHQDQIEPAGIGYQVRINQDDATRLELISGIGPRLAENIITHREQVGPFQSTEQLENVPRIGPRIRQRMEPWITLETFPDLSP